MSGALYKAAEKREEDDTRELYTVPRRLVPRGRKRVAFRKMFVGLAFLGAYVTFYPVFNFHVTIEDEFEAKRLLSRYVHHVVAHISCTLLMLVLQYTLPAGLRFLRACEVLRCLDPDRG